MIVWFNVLNDIISYVMKTLIYFVLREPKNIASSKIYKLFWEPEPEGFFCFLVGK